MSKDYSLYEKIDSMDQSLPVIFHRDHLTNRPGNNYIGCHWHEKIEFLFFLKGEAIIQCNSTSMNVKENDLVVVNSNELHQGHCLSDELDYYCIIVDTSLFQSRRVDICEAKYINPISQNLILFKNKIENDMEVAACINNFVKEFESKEIGYEMAIKACIYQLLVLLLRNYVQLVLTPREYDARMKNLKRLNNILEYIENNYTEKITIDQLCSMANISRFHFCRIFKDITGKSVGEYLNSIRVNKAETMLKETDMNITEVAMACGFNDINYFSRLFKEYKKISPSTVVKGTRG